MCVWWSNIEPALISRVSFAETTSSHKHTTSIYSAIYPFVPSLRYSPRMCNACMIIFSVAHFVVYSFISEPNFKKKILVVYYSYSGYAAYINIKEVQITSLINIHTKKWKKHHEHAAPLDYFNSADTIYGINVGLTLVQRRRRWTSVKATLILRLVSAGKAVIAIPHRDYSDLTCPSKIWGTINIIENFIFDSLRHREPGKFFKESSNCKMRMPGTVKCTPTVAYWVQIDGIIIATELITRY